MAEGAIGKNLTFPIKNSDGTSFHGLSLKKATYNTVVMSLGDKITGDVYYQDNTLAVTMQEYIEYQDNGSTVRFVLVNPPTVVKERMVSDNNGLNGMTKYSFEFYHPMYMLGNFPFTDVAVTSSQQKYLSQNKTFSWIGTFTDFVAKLNKNLQGTQWMVTIGSSVQNVDRTKLSDVMSFDKQTMAEAIKKGYETWEIPYVVDVVKSGESGYSEGKRFKVQYGLPTTEILVSDGQGGQTPYVFQCGQGVGLKNNSRTPRNNKIVTRIAGYGSETNIQYGYPQIPWTGDQSWNYTVNNSSSSANSYPIYDGIVNGQRTRLIKHPFTRTHLMPSIYRDTVNRKVNPLATGYDPTIEIKDYYDADGTYDNPMVSDSPSYEIHEFEKIKPELGDNRTLVSVAPMTEEEAAADYSSMSSFLEWLKRLQTQTNISAERAILNELYERIQTQSSWSQSGEDEEYWFSVSFTKDGYFAHVTFESANINFDVVVLYSQSLPTPDWDDTMDDNGNYVQSYFKVTIPQLDFDIYACAAVTQEMSINMRSGACLGCTFPVMVDWDDYKANFYDEDGNFAPSGEQRDLEKYPNSANGQVTLILKKEIETFGTLMPNIYQQPAAGDKFVILGIALPQVYVTNAESRLDADMLQYMRDNNVYYFDYPLKFDEYFLATHTNILSQMKNNVVVRFNYAGTVYALYIKQMSVKFGDKPLPQYDITLTDDVEIVLNQIGQVTSEVSSLRLMLGGSGDDKNYDKRYLRKDVDDTARGFLTLMKGMQVGSRFVTGLIGQGGVFRTEADGTTYIEADKLYIRMKAYFDTVEVKHYLHSGGNRIASKAGMNCTRVEYIDANGSVTTAIEDAKAFKCYFKAQDDSRKITNDFVVGDLAYCKETNVDTTSIEMHGYWRLVTGKSSSPDSDNEHWILLSNKASETVTIDGTSYTHAGYQSGSDAPIAYDDIIQLGNIADTTRQGAIVEMVSGADAPVYQIFQGINTFSLVDKNYVSMGYASGNTSLHSAGHAYLEVMGDFYFGDVNVSSPSSYIKYNSTTKELDVKANVKFTSPYTQQETDLEAFAAAVKANEEDLQSQIDGEIDTWFYEGTPTLSNAPAVDWNTVTLKERHLGDLYYDIGTGQTAGFAYRFVKTTVGGVDTYSWLYLEDTAITEALAMAAQAQDTADHKRRVFLTTPTPPYDQGDLWANATYPSSYTGETDEDNHKYNNDLLRCKTAKASGAAFSINDWQLASKYTDDSALYSFVNGTYATDKTNLQQQIDSKAETWYQDADPSNAWTTDEQKENHIGDLWCDTSQNGGKKTYIYKSRTSGNVTTYYWAEQAVPDAVFDKIDGKAAIYTNTTSNPPTDYHENDLWILPAAATINNVSYKQGDVLTATQDSSTYSDSHWTKKVCYTDDAALTDFISGSYAQTIQNLQSQVDEKAETWVSSSNPASQWTTTELKDAHVGDMWLNTSNSTIAGVGSMKTAVYTKNGSTYSWVVDDNIPNSVFDTIDGKKTIYVTWDSWVVGNKNTLQVRDLFIPSSNVTKNGVAYKANKVYRCLTVGAYNSSGTVTTYPTFQEVAYTDDTALTTFLQGTYITDKVNLQQQIDQKAETWYQATDPSTAWTTSALKSAHIGDLWHNSSSSTISGIEAGQDAMWNGTSWVPSSVPQDVFDKIDGKADIFVSKPTTYNINDLWIIESSLSSTDMPSGCKSGDIVISSATRTNNYKKADWTKKDRYTDDTVVNQIITKYGQILNITATAEGVGEALGKLRNVLGSSTEISGGLVLTNIIYMRDLAQTPKVRAGISGLYKTTETGTGYKGYGTAAWFGGGVSNGVPIDHEVSTSATDYAKSLFRFDGSGYVAGGNLKWSSDGTVTIQGTSINATTLQKGGVAVATTTDLSAYVTIATTQTISGTKTFSALLTASSGIKIGDATLTWDSTNNAIKVSAASGSAAINFYATGGISALGSGTSGGGGITLREPLSSINNINANPTVANKTLVWNGSSWVYGDIGTGNGTVTGVTVGSTAYSPVNGIVTLPAYPSTLDDIADGTTRKLANYLPLTGGTINNNTTYPLTIIGGNAYSLIHFAPRDTSGGNYIVDIGLHMTNLCGYIAFGKSPYGIISVDNSNAYYSDTSSNYRKYTIWHSGNDGTGSGLDADLLDGKHGSEYALATSLSSYLPLTGGTLTGALTVNNSLATKYFIYLNKALSTAADTGVVTSDQRIYAFNGQGSNAICSRFVSTYDPRDGKESYTSFFYGGGKVSYTTSGVDTQSFQSLELGNGGKRSTTYGLAGNILLYGQQNEGNSSTVRYGQIRPDVLTGNRIYTLPNDTGTIALTTSNVASATKLQTARTLWGQSFDGTANVDGTMTVSGSVIINQGSSSRNNGVVGIYDYSRAATVWAMGSSYNIAADGSGLGNLYGFAYAYKTLAAVGNLAGGHQIVFANAGTIYVAFGSDGLWSTRIKCTGNATIGGTLGVTSATTLSSTLSVAGGITLTTTKKIYFGDSSHYIELDSTGFHFSHGIYSDSFISALGSNSSSPSISLYEPLATINNIGTNPSSSGQTLVWNGTSWTYGNISSGSVTGVVVGSTAYSPINGIVTLPEYVTTSGNAASATKLNTSRTLWGQSFDGTANVDGTITMTLSGSSVLNAFNATSSAMTAGQLMTLWLGQSGSKGNCGQFIFEYQSNNASTNAVHIGFYSNYQILNILNSGNVGIGVTSPSYKLHVSGTLGVTGAATVGGALNVTGATTMSDTLAVNNYMYLYRAVTTADSGVKTSDQRIHVKVPTADTDTYAYALRFVAQYNPTNPTSPYTSYTTYFFSGLGSISFTTAAAGAQSYQTLVLGSTTKRNHTTAPAYAGRISLYQPQDEGASATVRAGTIQTAVLTAARTYTLPDATGTIALTTTNVASATKLQTARTIWGQSFDGTANIDGTAIMSKGAKFNEIYIECSSSGSYDSNRVREINTFTNPLHLQYASSTNLTLCFGGGNVGIGTNTPTQKLDVNGNANFSGSLSGVTNIDTLMYFDTTNSRVGIGTSTPAYKLDVYGNAQFGSNSDGTKIRLGSNNVSITDGSSSYNIMAMSKDSSNNWSCSFGYGLRNTAGSTTYVHGNAVSINSAGTARVYVTSGGNVGIGTSSPSQKLEVSGNVSISGASSLLMNGNNIYMYYANSSTNAYICTYTSNSYRAIAFAFNNSGYYEFTTNQFYAVGGIKTDRYVTALSDARHKNVLKSVSMTVEQVASMPAILYKWKDGRNDNSIYAGSIAQNWQTVLPEVVLKDDDKDGTLSMQYGVAALVASIITARKVVDHEKRIRELEMENNTLKREIEQLKAA